MRSEESKWVTSKEYSFYCGGKLAVNRYNEKVLERRKKYENLDFLKGVDFLTEDALKDIDIYGYTKIENFFEKREIEKLSEEFDKLILENKKVKEANLGAQKKLIQPYLNTTKNTSKHSHTFQNTSKYYKVLRNTTKYFQLFLSTSRHKKHF